MSRPVFKVGSGRKEVCCHLPRVFLWFPTYQKNQAKNTMGGERQLALFLTQRCMFPLCRALPLSILILSNSLLAFFFLSYCFPFIFSIFFLCSLPRVLWFIPVCYPLSPLISKCCQFFFQIFLPFLNSFLPIISVSKKSSPVSLAIPD